MSVSHTHFIAERALGGIDVTGLVKDYGKQRVLDGIDLHVDRGHVLALLGPNGAGKTTTVRILATLLAPDSGRALVAGYDVIENRREVRRRISLTGQYASLDELLTGRENLELVARLLRLGPRQARARADELLTRFELLDAADRRVAGYSGGMRRRLDLAAGLLGRPEVVFLDEPTTGLDPRSRQAIWDAVAALADEGASVLLTTQYLHEADALADRIALLDAGRIVADGSSAELKRRVGGERLELELSDQAAFDMIVAQLGARAMPGSGATLSVGIPVDGDAREIRLLLDALDPGRQRIERFSLHRTSLEDVFLALTGAGAAATAVEGGVG